MIEMFYYLQIVEMKRFPALRNRIVEVVSDMLFKRLNPTNDMVSTPTVYDNNAPFYPY